MVFSSETFLFLFLPLFLALYYLTPFRFRSALILAGSYLFYGWWRFDFLALLFLTTLWTYGIGHLIGANLGTRRARFWSSSDVRLQPSLADYESMPSLATAFPSGPRKILIV